MMEMLLAFVAFVLLSAAIFFLHSIFSLGEASYKNVAHKQTKDGKWKSDNQAKLFRIERKRKGKKQTQRKNEQHALEVEEAYGEMSFRFNKEERDDSLPLFADCIESDSKGCCEALSLTSLAQPEASSSVCNANNAPHMSDLTPTLTDVACIAEQSESVHKQREEDEETYIGSDDASSGIASKPPDPEEPINISCHPAGFTDQDLQDVLCPERQSENLEACDANTSRKRAVDMQAELRSDADKVEETSQEETDTLVNPADTDFCSNTEVAVDTGIWAEAHSMTQETGSSNLAHPEVMEVLSAAVGAARLGDGAIPLMEILRKKSGITCNVLQAVKDKEQIDHLQAKLEDQEQQLESERNFTQGARLRIQKLELELAAEHSAVSEEKAHLANMQMSFQSNTNSLKIQLKTKQEKHTEQQSIALQELSKVHEQYEEAVKRLKQEVSILKDALNIATSQHDAKHTAAMIDLRKQCNQLRQELAEKDQQLQKERDENKSLAAAERNLHVDVETLPALKIDLQEQLQQSSEELHSIKSRNGDVKAAWEQAGNELQRMKLRCLDLEAERKTMLAERRVTEEELHALRAELERLKIKSLIGENQWPMVVPDRCNEGTSPLDLEDLRRLPFKPCHEGEANRVCSEFVTNGNLNGSSPQPQRQQNRAADQAFKTRDDRACSQQFRGVKTGSKSEHGATLEVQTKEYYGSDEEETGQSFGMRRAFNHALTGSEEIDETSVTVESVSWVLQNCKSSLIFEETQKRQDSLIKARKERKLLIKRIKGLEKERKYGTENDKVTER
uniref:kinectin-like n=1 Tax=Myxine glutinosa TaxID=7769 RepID=UPI0035902E94